MEVKVNLFVVIKYKKEKGENYKMKMKKLFGGLMLSGALVLSACGAEE